MNWKPTAAVSGATLLATWLGWSPSTSLQPSAPPAATSPAPPAAGNDIEAQAARLQVHVRRELEYRDPSRNPFRFGARRPTAVPRQVQTPANVIQPAAASVPAVEPLPFTLAGMATENRDGTTQHTAILTAANDVLFVKEGDRVGGFTVTRIDETGIEVTATDGSVRRLILTP